MAEIIHKLLELDEPSVRWKVRVNVLGEDAASPAIRELQDEIRTSPRVKKLLSERAADGTIPHPPYSKWYGAHWVLAALADIGYPRGDAALASLAEQVCNRWLNERHVQGVAVIEGKCRRHASQESNALYALLTLGLGDERADRLAENLLKWQWPDGGWNCDRRPKAVNSSFTESIIGVRALALYGRLRNSQASLDGARRAAEIFLKRRLFRRQRDGRVMRSAFVKLHYPCYWHYDVLFGLKVMAEAGMIGDARCEEALDLLESKRLPDGGFPAEAVYYKTTEKRTKTGRRWSAFSQVDWGGVSTRRANPWVTADALYVLKAAGRI